MYGQFNGKDDHQLWDGMKYPSLRQTHLDVGGCSYRYLWHTVI